VTQDLVCFSLDKGIVFGTISGDSSYYGLEKFLSSAICFYFVYSFPSTA